MNEIEKVRSLHKPDTVDALFIGESAPVSGKFFYKGNIL
jgi:hypothetical protein